jgi:UDP-2,4-diacetamido-2,4,6-trideoxy-beta-L-altropyranose hydrolase
MNNQEILNKFLSMLILRTDADARMGTGHVMRCLALAQAWQEAGGQATFVMGIESPALETRLSSEGMDVIRLLAHPGSADDVQQTIDLALQRRAEWVVTDGYHFGVDYQQAIKDAGLRLLFVDDYSHAENYSADLVLNQNIYASEMLYPRRKAYTRLLLGTRYALLRREFRNWKGWNRKIPDVARRVLVTLGGADPDNVTLKVIRALQKIDIPDLDVNVIVGPANPHKKSLEDAMLSAPCSMSILENVNNMPKLMAWADIAVSAGGCTCWELACMGLANLILVLSENQQAIAEGLDAAGVAINLGLHERVSIDKVAQKLQSTMLKRETRDEMSRRGRTLVDGTGVIRVCNCLLKNPT